MSTPPPDASTPPRRVSPQGTIGPSTTLATIFAVTTDAWSPGTEIPARYTCDGDDISPPLVISQIPANTAELAIIVSDFDAGDFVHWVLAGIDPSVTAIEEGTTPEGSVQAANDAGTNAWFGPCPPEGESHTYDFTLYALSTPSGVVDGQDTETAVAAIKAAPTAALPAIMTGLYTR
jgi:Raf kinase inhibitor-like YbhB/YbcL family protein